MKARKKSRSRLENWDEMTEFLALVSKPEIRWKNSHARLEARDWKKEILDLVSKHEIERKKISISSRSMRLEERNSRSRLETRDCETDILDPVSKVEIGVSLDTDPASYRWDTVGWSPGGVRYSAPYSANRKWLLCFAVANIFQLYSHNRWLTHRGMIWTQLNPLGVSW